MRVSVSTNDLKNGMTLELDGTLFQVVEFQHVKPGKGGAFVRTKLRNVKTGAVVERTFNAGVKVGLAIVERKDMQYLYRDGDDFVFMDMETYDQIHVPPSVVGRRGANYLVGGRDGAGRDARGRRRSRSSCPPRSVPDDHRRRDPGAKGDTRTGAMKPADARDRARWSRCRCSSRRASGSRSTRGRASTSSA